MQNVKNASNKMAGIKPPQKTSRINKTKQTQAELMTGYKPNWWVDVEQVERGGETQVRRNIGTRESSEGADEQCEWGWCETVVEVKWGWGGAQGGTRTPGARVSRKLESHKVYKTCDQTT